MSNKINDLLRYAYNLQGWHTNRKIVVIESDDWGSIRMPSREVYDKCLEAGYRVDQNAYERYDSLLTGDDLDRLFNLLIRFNDSNGRHPIITANCVVANPDFKKIKETNFESYHYELITDTFNHYPNHGKNFEKWHEGMKSKVFYPQYHAREHLNVSLFIKALQNNDKDVHFGFENGMPGCISLNSGMKGNKYVEATNFTTLEDKSEKLNIYLEGLDIFHKLFGYPSATIIPPNYIWSTDFDKSVQDKGVRFIQGVRIINEPIKNGKYKQHRVFLGKRNKIGQYYLIRNSIFEPSLFDLGIAAPVDRCLSDIDIAFKSCKPAVISSHRLNYVGFLCERNRDQTLKYLHLLLKLMLKTWPNIEFMTSEELGWIVKDSTE